MFDPNKIAPGYSSKVLGGNDDDLTFVGVFNVCWRVEAILSRKR